MDVQDSGRARHVRDRASPGSITRLVRDWEGGNEEAKRLLLERLFPMLVRIAGKRWGAALARNSWEAPEGLVNAAVVRFLERVNAEPAMFSDRGALYGWFAQTMRRILIDYDRKRRAQKRAGLRVTLDEVAGGGSIPKEIEYDALYAALDELERDYPLEAKIVELRYFVGLSLQETADVTCLPVIRVRREWTLARARLIQRLSE